MKSKRNLSADIRLDCTDITNSPLDADINKIKAAVNGSLSSAHSERRLYMKQRLLITIAVAASAALVLGASGFAASGLIKSWHSSSSGIADYTTLPTKEQATKDAGYAPLLIEAFGNGYTFTEGSVIKNALKD